MIMERGNFYVFCWPAPGMTTIEGPWEIGRLAMVLRPHQDVSVFRLIELAQPRMPDDEELGGEEVAATVRLVTPDAQRIRRYLEFGAESRAMEARPVGEGVFVLAEHAGHTHLAYFLELPHQPGEVQDRLGLGKEANYLIAVESTEPSASELRLRNGGSATLGHLQQTQIGPALNMEGTAVRLLATRPAQGDAFLRALNPQHETEVTAEISDELELCRTRHVTSALLHGPWR